MKFRKLTALVGASMLVFAACSSTPPAATTGASGSAAPSVDTSKGTVKFAIELPQQGSEKAASDPIINGIKLAVKQAGGGAGGYKIDIPQGSIFDDALNGAHDPQTGANNMSQIVADPDTIAVIGPLNSSVAVAQIPISNEGGLFHCSPANTNPDLTKGAPAAQLRTKPNNYIRVVTTDDVQGPAAAQYIIDVLKKTNVYVIDDTETFGKGVADAFAAEFTKRGGKVVKHDAAPKTTQDYVSIMTAAKALNPDSIYFGGVTATGGARILLAAQQAGLATSRTSGLTGSTTAPARRRTRSSTSARPLPRTPTARSPASASSRARPSSIRTTRPSTGSTQPATRAWASPAPRSPLTPSAEPGRPTRPT